MVLGDVIITEEIFNGNPIIRIDWADDDRWPFKFGRGKAKLLLAALRQDPEFVERFIEETKR